MLPTVLDDSIDYGRWLSPRVVRSHVPATEIVQARLRCPTGQPLLQQRSMRLYDFGG